MEKARVGMGMMVMVCVVMAMAAGPEVARVDVSDSTLASAAHARDGRADMPCEGFGPDLPGAPWVFGPENDVVETVEYEAGEYCLQMACPNGAAVNVAEIGLDFADELWADIADADFHVVCSFRYMNIGEEVDAEDGAYVIVDDTPTMLHDLGNTDGEWQEVTVWLEDVIGVDALRAEAGFTVMFREADDRAWPADGMRIDDVCIGFDCDENGIVDSMEFTDDPALDCNSNGLLDVCELTPDKDCDDNGMLDECQTDLTDCNTNGVWDICEPDLTDCNDNGIMDICEAEYWENNGDDDDDGVIDFCDEYPLGPDATPAADRFWVWQKLIVSSQPSDFVDDMAQYADLKSFEEMYPARRMEVGEVAYVEIWASFIESPAVDVPGLTSGLVEVMACGECALEIDELYHGAKMDQQLVTGTIMDCAGFQDFGWIEDFGAATDNFQPLAVFNSYLDWEWIMLGRFEIAMPEQPCGLCADPASGEYDVPPGAVWIETADWGMFGPSVPEERIYSPNGMIELTQRCRAWMYDVDGNGWINVFDLGVYPAECGDVSFIDAWLTCEGDEDYCDYFDWQDDGCIDAGDLGMFITGYELCCDDPGILLPGGRGETLAPPATDEFIESLGLPLPPKNWRQAD